MTGELSLAYVTDYEFVELSDLSELNALCERIETNVITEASRDVLQFCDVLSSMILRGSARAISRDNIQDDLREAARFGNRVEIPEPLDPVIDESTIRWIAYSHPGRGLQALSRIEWNAETLDHRIDRILEWPLRIM